MHKSQPCKNERSDDQEKEAYSIDTEKLHMAPGFQFVDALIVK
jgi:hypothetical protein